MKIGNSAGVILPKDALNHLNASVGDVLHLSSNADGLELRPHEADFAAQMAAARDVMQRRRRALRELAK